MNWKKERDLFVAQTLAFVQSLGTDGGKSEAATKSDSKIQSSQWKPSNTGGPVGSTTTNRPNEVEIRGTKSSGVAPSKPGEFRREIERHILNFRAHQQRFHREREEYFKATLARARAANANASGTNNNTKLAER